MVGPVSLGEDWIPTFPSRRHAVAEIPPGATPGPRPFPYPAPEAGAPGVVWTGSGLLDLHDPEPARIHPGDISRGLSRQPRFGGHTVDPWSVLQHSLLVEYLARIAGEGAEVRLACILHDAPEYLLGDMVQPLKAILPGYREVEGRLTLAVRERFGLVPRRGWPEVTAYDHAALQVERALFLPAGAWEPAPPQPTLRVRLRAKWLADQCPVFLCGHFEAAVADLTAALATP